MERELSLNLKNMNKTNVFDVLLDKNADAPVPNAGSSRKFRRSSNRLSSVSRGQQFDPNQLPNELFQEQAERRVRLGILVCATVKKLELQADEERVRALIDEMAAAYDDPEQVVNFYYSNDDNLKQVEALTVEEQVAEVLLESAKVKTIDMSYADVMKSRQA